MKDRRDIAIELIHGGMNCAQAVILVFKDELDAPETLLKQAVAVLCRCEDCVRNAVALVQERIKDPDGEGTPRDEESRIGTSAEK